MLSTNTNIRTTLVAGLLSIATCAAAQTSAPVVFQGLTHTPVGSATLRLDTSRHTLDVLTADPDGGDGVAVDTGQATNWTASQRVSIDPSRPLGMTWTAIADGQAISTARLRQSGDRFALSARFTGATGSTSTYAIHVYDNGRLVGSLGGVPPTAQIFVPISSCSLVEIFHCDFVTKFLNDVDLNCGWELAFASAAPMTIELPNGVRVKGNEVLLLEEGRGAGHYPYLAFDGLMLQTNASTLTLFSESVR
jgi:hypothetical protein